MKRINFLMLLLFASLSLPAQKRPGGVFDHVINVEAYSDWGTGYLTVVDPHYFFTKDESVSATFVPVEDDAMPEITDIILELNGKSTKGMSPKEFYAMTDTVGTFALKLADKKGNIKNATIVVKYSRPDEYLNKYVDLQRFLNSTQPSLSNLGKRVGTGNTKYYEIADDNFDFRNVHTYDYHITGNDPLNDAKILNEIHKLGLTRDTENPDILFTVAKNADESISATYVPPTSRTVNTGSYTTTRYNYITKRPEFITRQNNQTIHEGGYTQTTKVASIYLELAALDAKRLNDKSVSYAPIVWQMTTKRNATNYDFDVADEYLAYASWACMPPIDRWVNADKDVYEVTGLIPDKDNPALVAEVVKGSRAEKAGFQKGDIIKEYVYGIHEDDHVDIHTGGVRHIVHNYYTVTPKEKKLKKETEHIGLNIGVIKDTYNSKSKNPADFEIITSMDNPDIVQLDGITITLVRNKKKQTIRLRSRSAKFSRGYLLSNEQLKKLKK